MVASVDDLCRLFALDGLVGVVTGGTGALGGAMARGLAVAGARVAVSGRHRDRAEQVAAEIAQRGGEAMAVPADVLRKEQLTAACEEILDRWGRIDILLNAAGGHVPGSVVGETAFFDLPEAGLRHAIDLNLLGTILPAQVFAASMAGKTPPRGCVINISSMAAGRPLTNIVAYSAAKAGVENFTRWLAVELVRRHGPGMRVNAIAPGFFVADQNREFLAHPDGSPTERGQRILQHTPAGRFGEPEDLVGTAIWLCSPGANFVNGVVVPVDGGFSAFGGV